MCTKSVFYVSQIVLMLALCLPLTTYARVRMGLSLPFSKTLVDEPVRVQAAIQNTSSRLLSFGACADSATLRFDVEDAVGRLIKPFREGSVLEGADIMPGEIKTFEVVVSRLYGLRSPRRYRISAVIDWGGVTYASPHVWLEVTRGFEISRTSAGVLGDEEAMRVYVLKYIQRDRPEAEYLYLHIEDARDGRIYGVFNLGRLVRVRQPLLRTDTPGNAHVLFETVGRNMVHTAYTPYGEQLFSTAMPAGRGGRASLKQRRDGRLEVETESEMRLGPRERAGEPSH